MLIAMSNSLVKVCLLIHKSFSLQCEYVLSIVNRISLTESIDLFLLEPYGCASAVSLSVKI